MQVLVAEVARLRTASQQRFHSVARKIGGHTFFTMLCPLNLLVAALGTHLFSKGKLCVTADYPLLLSIADVTRLWTVLKKGIQSVARSVT
jgi:hypothetical protein